MPITALDPATALVVIDLQVGVMAIQTAPYPSAAVAANAAKLARAFRSRGLPVVLVNVAGMSPGRADVPRPNLGALPPNWTELTPELEHQPTDLLVTKYSVGAFYGTALDLHLRRRAVTQVVLCGIATGSGVESTARGAHDRGYHLTFVIDAMADRSADIHTHCVEKVFPRIGETGTTLELLGKLA
jgi:nicotinamidase-related amidase